MGLRDSRQLGESAGGISFLKVLGHSKLRLRARADLFSHSPK